MYLSYRTFTLVIGLSSFLIPFAQKALLPADQAFRSHFPNPIHSPQTQISFTAGILSFYDDSWTKADVNPLKYLWIVLYSHSVKCNLG